MNAPCVDQPIASPAQPEDLFSAEQTAAPRPAPRLRQPDRSGLCLDVPLDDLLPDDDVARLLWDLAQPLDFSPWYDDIKAVQGQPGRDANDPRLLFVLWLQATLDGVRSARKLRRLCYRHLSYIWLRGNVSVNYHSLASFRSRHPQPLEQLLTQTVAAMAAEGLIDLEVTAQDGLRIRASAGAGSFRRRATLEESQHKAQQYMEQLEQSQDDEVTPRQAAARRRHARERLQRVNGALEHLGQIEQQREEHLRPDQEQTRAKQPPRASTTDPECRKMKMPDGGYRPAFNAQLNTAAHGGVIVGVEVINAGNDYGQAEPMLQQTEESYGQLPDEHLVDGGFARLEEIERIEQKYPQTKLYAPVRDAAKQEAAGKDPYAAKKGDKPGVVAWRARMGSEAGKQKYKQRAATAEWANAQLRNRGLYQVTVRGLAQVKAVVLLYALAHNFTRWIALRQAALAKAS